MIAFTTTRPRWATSNGRIYGSAKAGVDTLTKYVATMYGKQEIRGNTIEPGLKLSAPAVANLLDATLRNGRCDAAGFIMGPTFNVDGGVLAHHPAYSQNVVSG
jgi:NAD(P)-dependent dehydrogenase (short-subunit alcohol dehydrogenase family)